MSGTGPGATTNCLPCGRRDVFTRRCSTPNCSPSAEKTHSSLPTARAALPKGPARRVRRRVRRAGYLAGEGREPPASSEGMRGVRQSGCAGVGCEKGLARWRSARRMVNDAGFALNIYSFVTPQSKGTEGGEWRALCLHIVHVDVHGLMRCRGAARESTSTLSFRLTGESRSE